MAIYPSLSLKSNIPSSFKESIGLLFISFKTGLALAQVSAIKPLHTKITATSEELSASIWSSNPYDDTIGPSLTLSVVLL